MLFTENSKLEPNFNLYQYPAIFFAAVIIDIFIHFFSQRKFKALKGGYESFGFAPEIYYYYNSLCKKGPLTYTPNQDTFFNNCNSWLSGAFIAGTIAVFTLLLSEIILYLINNKYNENTSNSSDENI